MHSTQSQYTLVEEIVHAVSHGAGVILSIAGLSWMLYLSIGTSDPWRIVASCVYGASLISLFLASTMYLKGAKTPSVLSGCPLVHMMQPAKNRF